MIETVEIDMVIRSYSVGAQYEGSVCPCDLILAGIHPGLNDYSLWKLLVLFGHIGCNMKDLYIYRIRPNLRHS